jgi:arylsulfatase
MVESDEEPCPRVGNQGIYHDGWMASAIRGVPWLSENEPGDLLNMPWELYHVD